MLLHALFKHLAIQISAANVRRPVLYRTVYSVRHGHWWTCPRQWLQCVLISRET